MEKHELTEELADQLCYEKWDWHIKHPTKNTNQWPRWKFNGGDIPIFTAYCPYCHLYFKPSICVKCPLKIATGKKCFHSKSLWSKWNKARFTWTHKRYARQIRDIAGARLKLGLLGLIRGVLGKFVI